jgi:hypothetical protein
LANKGCNAKHLTGDGDCLQNQTKDIALLIPIKTLERIRLGEVDLAFRRWQKPTVKTGGRLRNSLGELAIVNVEIVDPATISDSDAVRAGFDSAETLTAELFRERKPSARARTAKPNEHSQVYRVEIRYVGEDNRIALRAAELSDEDLAALAAKVRLMETRSSRGDWATRALTLIERWPCRRAPELAELENLETVVFKTSVRRLKELGLTESMRVGYQLSPLGVQVLNTLRTPKQG